MKVFLADDEIVIREGIRESFPWEETPYVLVGEAPDGEMALPMIRDTNPDIVITDIKMPFMDGIELCKTLRAQMPWIGIVVLSGYDEFEYARQCIALGVREYLLKPINAEELKKVLDKVSAQIAEEKKASLHAASLRARMEMGGKLVKEKLLLYKKLSGPMEVQFREQVNNEILSSLRIFAETVQKSQMKYEPKTLDTIIEGVQGMEGIFATAKKGDMQELLTIYKELLPKAEYKKLRTQTESVTEALDKAIKTETDDFFDKFRDLKLGSAPTDVMSILISLGSVGLALGLADNKDERISATLKYGIPAVGGITTALVLTSNLVSGFAGMGLGLLSSIVLNEAGNAVDKFRKNVIKHREYLKTQEEQPKKELAAAGQQDVKEEQVKVEATV